MSRRIQALAAAFALTLGLGPVVGHAAEPSSKAPEAKAKARIKPQAPGYYRQRLGAFEVIALNDGTAALPFTELLRGASKEELNEMLARDYLRDPVEMSFNAFLVNTGSQRVLIDSGAGQFYGPALGGLANNLRAAGYKPEQVDAVLITHLHPDHVSGIMNDGKRVFPNANIYVDQRELDEWLNTDKRNAARGEAQAFYDGASEALTPYKTAGRLKTFTGDTQVVPGVRAVSAYGHTPGHTVFEVRSGDDTLLVVGDTVHQASVQFARPDVTIQFDTDPAAAATQRRRLWDMAARDGHIIAAAHIAFPGLGHVRAEGDGYRWIPLNYTLNQ